MILIEENPIGFNLSGHHEVLDLGLQINKRDKGCQQQVCFKNVKG